MRWATEHIAPVSDARWHSDFALGFLASHVTVGLQMAFAQDLLRRFRKPWWTSEEIFALHREMIPEPMGFEPLVFRTAFDDVVKRWPMGDQPVTPVVEGALLASSIIHSTLTFGRLQQQRDDWTLRVYEIEKEYSRLPGRHPAVRLVWRPPGKLYRYLVLRTLGMTEFGISAEQARRLALED